MSKWIDRFKEKEGKKGLLPWLSVRIQRWILIGLACVGVIGTIVTIVNGSYLPVGLLLTAIGATALWVGFKTSWVRDLDRASKPIKVAGAILIGAGTLLAIALLAYVLFYVVIIILAIVLFFLFIIFILKAYFGGEDRGEIKGRAGEVIRETRIIREKIIGQGSSLIDESGIKIGEIQKAWFSDDQIIRDDGGMEIGRIKQNIWNESVQDICDEDGSKVGEIKTNVLGEREIVDNSGHRVGV